MASQLFYAQAQAWKSAADAAPGPRGEQEEKPPPTRSQARIWRLAADAACGPRGRAGRDSPLLDSISGYVGECKL